MEVSEWSEYKGRRRSTSVEEIPQESDLSKQSRRNLERRRRRRIAVKEEAPSDDSRRAAEKEEALRGLLKRTEKALRAIQACVLRPSLVKL